MPEYSVPYGRNRIGFFLSENRDALVIEPGSQPGLEDPAAALAAQLSALDGRYPAGPHRRTVAVAINDKTRPVPHHVLLPGLLAALERWGYRRTDILFVIAVGSHGPMPPDEYPLVMPDGIAEGCRIESHDAADESNLVSVGTTSRGTPCRVNRDFAEAHLRIVVGNIEPHQFMGWSGGSKSAAIGLVSRETIAANHSMLGAAGAGPCRYGDNPVRQDVEEMGRLIGVHLAVNVVMNSRKDIVAVLAGDPEDVMARGITAGEKLFAVSVPARADLVIVSAGGHPKDINLYQAQKALRHGALAAKPEAPIIIVAACTEGVGSRSYREWMEGKTSHRQVQAAFGSEEFQLGPHKGMLFAGDAIGRDVYLVSRLPEETVRAMLLEPAESVEAALDAINSIATGAGRPIPRSVAVIPYGNATVPVPAEA